MILELIDDETEFGLIQITNFDEEQNISAYERLEFWYYSETADTNRTLQVQLSIANADGLEIENTWNWNSPVAWLSSRSFGT